MFSESACVTEILVALITHIFPDVCVLTPIMIFYLLCGGKLFPISTHRTCDCALFKGDQLLFRFLLGQLLAVVYPV